MHRPIPSSEVPSAVHPLHFSPHPRRNANPYTPTLTHTHTHLATFYPAPNPSLSDRHHPHSTFRCALRPTVYPSLALIPYFRRPSEPILGPSRIRSHQDSPTMPCLLLLVVAPGSCSIHSIFCHLSYPFRVPLTVAGSHQQSPPLESRPGSSPRL